MRAAWAFFAIPLLSSEAAAVEVSNWGVGLRVGTVVLPGRMPVALPRAARVDLDVDGEPRLDGARGDISVGIHGIYHATRRLRLGMMGNLGGGSGGYFDAHALLLGDGVLATTATIDLLAGVGLGAGWNRYRTDEVELSATYYAIRGHVAGMAHFDFLGFQLGIFTQWDVPSRQLYTDITGAEEQTRGGFDLAAGVELTVFFGDFDFSG